MSSLERGAVGIVGALIGCVLGPIIGLRLISLLDSGPISEGDFMALGFLLAIAGAGIGAAVAIQIATKR
jgi:hypothetical protein